jgi:hypothetical protein
LYAGTGPGVWVGQAGNSEICWKRQIVG